MKQDVTPKDVHLNVSLSIWAGTCKLVPFSFGFQYSFEQWQINRGTASRGMGEKKKFLHFLKRQVAVCPSNSFISLISSRILITWGKWKKRALHFAPSITANRRNPKLHSWNTVRQKRFECQKSAHTHTKTTKNPRRRFDTFSRRTGFPQRPAGSGLTASLRAPSSAAPALFCPGRPEPPLPPSFPLRLRRTAKRALVIVLPG